MDLSNYCVHTGDTGRGVEKVRDHLLNTAHVPVQTWKNGTQEAVLEDGSLG